MAHWVKDPAYTFCGLGHSCGSVRPLAQELLYSVDAAKKKEEEKKEMQSHYNEPYWTLWIRQKPSVLNGVAAEKFTMW